MKSENKDKISRLKRIVEDYDWVTHHSYKDLGLEQALECRNNYIEEILEIIKTLAE